jgi:hypothetical protein
MSEVGGRACGRRRFAAVAAGIRADGFRRALRAVHAAPFVRCLVQSRSARWSGSTVGISHTGSPAALARSSSVWKALFSTAAHQRDGVALAGVAAGDRLAEAGSGAEDSN